MDVDTLVSSRAPEWARLEQLTRRRRRLTGEQADELVELYQRAAADLSLVRSAVPDPALVARLTTLVARARGKVAGSDSPAWSTGFIFLTQTFPVCCWRLRWWWLTVAVAFLVISVSIGAWVATNVDVQASIGTPDEIRQIVNHDAVDYYSTGAASSFAAQVWTNNAWVAALSIAFGGLLGIPVFFAFWQNALNAGVLGGLMYAYGRGDVFWGLVMPHGLLELSAVFLAMAAGLRLGWTMLAPGLLPRGRALAEQGRRLISVSLGLVLVLAVSGVIEAFVTPSGWPTAVRVGIGVAALLGFLAWVLPLGRAGERRGVTGDLEGAGRTDVLPVRG